MNPRLLALAMACASALSGATINRAVRTKRKPGAAAVSSACLLSLDARLMRIGMKGAEPILPESEEWRNKLREMVKHSVAASGLTLAGDLSTPEDQAREAVMRVKQRYESVAVQLNKKPKKVGEGRYTLGDEVALAPCSSGADVLLFVNAAGRIQTGSRKAFSLIVGGYAGLLMAQSDYQISMAFVDARTGDVIGFTRIFMIGGKTGKDPDTVLANRLAEEFAKMRTVAPTP